MTRHPRRAGRRPGSPNTREQIRTAAQEAFATRGFDATSVRSVAAAAGVDPALVHHYFGSKEGLFLSTLQFPMHPDRLIEDVFAEGPDGVPERLVRTFVSLWDAPETGPALLGMLRTAATEQPGGGLLREFFTTQILRRVVARLTDEQPVSDAALRVSLVGSQLLGLALTRSMLRLGMMATAEVDTLVAAIAPTIRRYLFEDLGTPSAE